MTAHLARFERALEAAYQEVVLGRLVAFHKTVAETAYAMVAADTRATGGAFGSPVRSGRYAASHTLAIGGADASVAPGPVRSSGADQRRVVGRSPGYVRGRLAALGPFELVVIANALPYARRLELGHSRLKAPAGVYDVTAAAVEVRFAAVRDGSERP